MKKTVCIIFKNDLGEILLLLRDNKPGIPYPNQWYILGGIVEEGETYEEAIAREMLEELGLELDIRNLKRMKVYDWPEKEEVIFHQKKDIDVDGINLQEGQEIRYFSRAEIAQMDLAFHDNQIAEDFFKSIK
jgi:8-oxo-dGTP diphosphatase